jgi:hypothetical protein
VTLHAPVPSMETNLDLPAFLRRRATSA